MTSAITRLARVTLISKPARFVNSGALPLLCGIGADVEKTFIQSEEDRDRFVRQNEVDPPKSLPCVAVTYLIDPDPYPSYTLVEYVYLSDFDA
jgi:hypothetical protein